MWNKIFTRSRSNNYREQINEIKYKEVETLKYDDENWAYIKAVNRTATLSENTLKKVHNYYDRIFRFSRGCLFMTRGDDILFIDVKQCKNDRLSSGTDSDLCVLCGTILYAIQDIYEKYNDQLEHVFMLLTILINELSKHFEKIGDLDFIHDFLLRSYGIFFKPTAHYKMKPNTVVMSQSTVIKI